MPVTPARTDTGVVLRGRFRVRSCRALRAPLDGGPGPDRLRRGIWRTRRLGNTGAAAADAVTARRVRVEEAPGGKRGDGARTLPARNRTMKFDPDPNSLTLPCSARRRAPTCPRETRRAPDPAPPPARPS